MKVGGNLECHSSEFSNNDGNAFNAKSVHVSGAFVFREVQVKGSVDLTSMCVHTLVDDVASWPRELKLTNFRYDEIHYESPLDARSRIDWLKYQPKPFDLDPQPWRQAAAALRKQGHEADARAIMLRYWRRRIWLAPQRYADENETAKSIWSAIWLLPQFMYWLVVGYGYARWRALWWIMLFWILGSFIFGSGNGTNMKESHPYAMRSRMVINELSSVESVPPEHRWLETMYPAFNPWIYSLDTFLPIVDFHQDTYWTPRDNWVRWLYLPLHILAGWGITTLFVVSFTGLVRRGDE